MMRRFIRVAVWLPLLGASWAVLGIPGETHLLLRLQEDTTGEVYR